MKEKTMDELQLTLSISPQKWAAIFYRPCGQPLIPLQPYGSYQLQYPSCPPPMPPSFTSQRVLELRGTDKTVNYYFMDPEQVASGDIIELIGEINLCLRARGLEFQIANSIPHLVLPPDKLRGK
jgi:hypothetical protein